MNEIGIVVGFGDVGEDKKSSATVEGFAIGQVFADDVIGEVAGPAHDALFDVPGIGADLEHFEVVIGFEDEAVGVTQMEFYEFGEIAEIGDDGDFCAVGAKGVADRIGGVVRNGEGRNFDVADGEALARADMFDAVELFCGGFGQNANDFRVGSFGEVSSGFPMSEKLRKSAGVVGVFVRNENAVDAFGGFFERGEAAKSFFAAKSGVDEEAGALCFKQCGIARTARGQDGNSKADEPSRAAR